MSQESDLVNFSSGYESYSPSLLLARSVASMPLENMKTDSSTNYVQTQRHSFDHPQNSRAPMAVENPGSNLNSDTFSSNFKFDQGFNIGQPSTTDSSAFQDTYFDQFPMEVQQHHLNQSVTEQTYTGHHSTGETFQDGNYRSGLEQTSTTPHNCHMAESSTFSNTYLDHRSVHEIHQYCHNCGQFGLERTDTNTTAETYNSNTHRDVVVGLGVNAHDGSQARGTTIKSDVYAHSLQSQNDQHFALQGVQMLPSSVPVVENNQIAPNTWPELYAPRAQVAWQNAPAQSLDLIAKVEQIHPFPNESSSEIRDDFYLDEIPDMRFGPGFEFSSSLGTVPSSIASTPSSHYSSECGMNPASMSSESSRSCSPHELSASFPYANANFVTSFPFQNSGMPQSTRDLNASQHSVSNLMGVPSSAVQGPFDHPSVPEESNHLKRQIPNQGLTTTERPVKRAMFDDHSTDLTRTSQHVYSLPTPSNPHPDTSASASFLSAFTQHPFASTQQPLTSGSAAPVNTHPQISLNEVKYQEKTSLENKTKQPRIFSWDPKAGYKIFLGPESAWTTEKKRSCQWKPDLEDKNAPICGFVTESLENFTEHLMTHIPPRGKGVPKSMTVTCLWKPCGMNVSHSSFARHCATKHSPWANVCMMCGLDVDFYRDRKSHREGGEDSDCAYTREMRPGLVREVMMYYGKTDPEALKCLKEVEDGRQIW
ncbi:hypothetical protein K435DRAFT_965700 [Dendrothele bispora CBS 962.96]|uniref:Uncharacterized protein n=1 Tax=Dendrothele bispora (strain CBS 962.96) TaxID=1314807 RepID=A0A4S8M417_DENBC|nr:hypothetical protein K435DRAFT_965700 [Dendrothele bispora CBS 962.96]